MTDPFRWLILLTLATAMSISATFRHRARKVETIKRKREGGIWILARLTVALPLFFSIITYVVSPSWMAWSEIALPCWLRWLGAGAALISLPGIYALFSIIGSNISETVLTKDSHQLVTTGPYRWVRHPLYSISLLMLTGIGLMATNVFILALVLVSLLGVMAMIVPAEERNLVQRFGEEYESYRARTGKLVPWVG